MKAMDCPTSEFEYKIEKLSKSHRKGSGKRRLKEIWAIELSVQMVGLINRSSNMREVWRECHPYIKKIRWCNAQVQRIIDQDKTIV